MPGQTNIARQHVLIKGVLLLQQPKNQDAKNALQTEPLLIQMAPQIAIYSLTNFGPSSFLSFINRRKIPIQIKHQASPTETCLSILIPAIINGDDMTVNYIFYQDRLMNVGRQSQYGRGRGSYRQGMDKSYTPEKGGQKSSFRAKKNINFDPKEYMVAECSVRDVEIFKQVFDFLDDDYDGMLTPMDLRKAIREYGGYKPGRPFVYVAMSVFDADDGGQITFKEFVKLMTQKPCTSDTEEDIERIFQNFDEDNKGFISEEDLITAAEELNEEVTPAEIKEMIAQCDPEGQGVIRLDQFIAFNKRKNFD